MKSIRPVILATSLLASGVAMAADKETILSSMEGQVMVNQGQAYVAASESMLLYPGDRLMVMRGGSAQLQFANGCIQTLQGNEIATVGTAESCSNLQAAGTYNQVGKGTPAAKGGGVSGTAAGGTASTVGGLVIAGTAIGIGVGIDKNSGGRSDPPPASP
ncbi:hypothetical protein F0M18_17105 [Pseudohalioglobus sediminis]|uniref:Uncharacterized protein n=1 Tax=Pseudohalioglobus sediminis TaxID=2606449 RepID=A0A5B0WRR4_9GAMM|nr:hypothetical protein [Pseudohalioglobus sediminis]KAA1188921.1 hypothetical protein F0M18_17105 [Pseudohalioglobus sediminis]